MRTAEATINQFKEELKVLRKEHHNQKEKHAVEMMNMVRCNDAQEKNTLKSEQRIKLFDSKVRKVSIQYNV